MLKVFVFKLAKHLTLLYYVFAAFKIKIDSVVDLYSPESILNFKKLLRKNYAN